MHRTPGCSEKPARKLVECSSTSGPGGPGQRKVHLSKTKCRQGTGVANGPHSPPLQQLPLFWGGLSGQSHSHVSWPHNASSHSHLSLSKNTDMQPLTTWQGLAHSPCIPTGQRNPEVGRRKQMAFPPQCSPHAHPPGPSSWGQAGGRM